MKSFDKRARLDWEHKEQVKQDRIHQKDCMDHMDHFGMPVVKTVRLYTKDPLDDITPRQRKRLKNEQRREAQEAQSAIEKERDALGVYGVW